MGSGWRSSSDCIAAFRGRTKATAAAEEMRAIRSLKLALQHRRQRPSPAMPKRGPLLPFDYALHPRAFSLTIASVLDRKLSRADGRSGRWWAEGAPLASRFGRCECTLIDGALCILQNT